MYQSKNEKFWMHCEKYLRTKQYDALNSGVHNPHNINLIK